MTKNSVAVAFVALLAFLFGTLTGAYLYARRECKMGNTTFACPSDG